MAYEVFVFEVEGFDLRASQKEVGRGGWKIGKSDENFDLLTPGSRKFGETLGICTLPETNSSPIRWLKMRGHVSFRLVSQLGEYVCFCLINWLLCDETFPNRSWKSQGPPQCHPYSWPYLFFYGFIIMLVP